jgi:hypothetical protein
MKCRSCGTAIADRAIVCFRCGAPTDMPAPPPRRRAPAPRRRRAAAPLAAVIVVAIIALAVWLLPRTPAGSPARWAGWAAVVVTTAAAVWWVSRRR